MTKLDRWLNDHLDLNIYSIEHYSDAEVNEFYSKVKCLPACEYCDGEGDNGFLVGLKEAANGDHAMLSYFLATSKAMTETKKLMLAWVLLYPRKKMLLKRNRSARLSNAVQHLAALEIWCNYSKEQAVIEVIRMFCQIGPNDGSERWQGTFDSKRSTIYRAISAKGEYRGLYESTKNQMQEDIARTELERMKTN